MTFVPLPHEKYATLEPLLKAWKYHSPLIESLYHHKTGIFYVDNLDNISFSIAIHPSGWSVIFGKANPFILQKLCQNITQNYFKWRVLVLEIYQDQWIKPLLSLHSFSLNFRQIHELNSASFQKIIPSPIENDEEIRDIRTLSWDKLTQFDNSIMEAWQENNFFSESSGLALFKSGQLIAVIWSYFKPRTLIECSIYVKAQNRGNGFAYKLAYTFLENCLKQNQVPRWSCNSNQESSVKLAQSLGFHNINTCTWLGTNLIKL